MPLYNPPTKVATRQIPFIALVSRVDPNWNRYKHWEIEYEFTRRVFFADPYVSGPYNKTFDNPNIPLGEFYNVNADLPPYDQVTVPPYG